MTFTYSNSLEFSLQICLMSLKQFFRNVNVTEDFINLGCFSISLKTLILNTMVLLWIFNFPKLFLLLEVFKNLPLMKRNQYNALPFYAKNLLVLFYYIGSIFGFLYPLSSLFQFFYFNGVVCRYGFNQLLFDFIFVKTLCLLAVFRVSPQLKTKNNRYIINLKHPL